MSVEFANRAEAAQAVELVRKANQEALSDPVTLARYLDPKFVVRSHTKAIGAELAAVARGESSRLLVTLPPQVGKSWLAAMWGPFWWLARHPTHRVIVACYGQQLAVGRGRAIRRMVMEHGWRYGLHIERGSASVHEWSMTSGGGVKAVGTGSSVTGSPADVIFVDDVVKGRQEAESLHQRDTISDWWSADLLSRLAPGAPLVMLGTLWHYDDQYARVLAQDGRAEDGGLWRVLRMPAYADRADDPLGREFGEPLPHPKLGPDDSEGCREHWNDRRKQTQVRDWNALYMCDPQPSEGALVSAALLRARRHHPPQAQPRKYGVAVDPSGGGRDLAGVIGGYLAEDGRLYLDADDSITGPSEQWAMNAALLAAERRAEFIVVEKNYGGDMTKVAIGAAWDSITRISRGEVRPEDSPEVVARCESLTPGVKPQVKLAEAKRNKLLRAEPIAQQWVDDRLRTGVYLPELEGEWQTWQPTDPNSPGRIDASVYLAYELLPIPGSEALVSSHAGVTRDEVARRASQRGGQRRVQRPTVRPN